MHFDPDLLDQLRSARHIAVFTGAGVSAGGRGASIRSKSRSPFGPSSSISSSRSAAKAGLRRVTPLHVCASLTVAGPNPAR